MTVSLVMSFRVFQLASNMLPPVD